MRLTSPGAKASPNWAASVPINRRFWSPAARVFSNASNKTFWDFSTAIKRVSGQRVAVPTANWPLPQPISRKRSPFWPNCSRQLPRSAGGSATSKSAQASIRGIRFFFLRIRMAVSSQHYILSSAGIISHVFAKSKPSLCADVQKADGNSR